MIPEADYFPTLGPKRTGSSRITQFSMLGSVQFNDDLLADAAEIRNVGRNWMLAAELQPAQLSAAQKLPQLALRLRHFPYASGVSFRAWWLAMAV
jgi:hypothetical protein